MKFSANTKGGLLPGLVAPGGLVTGHPALRASVRKAGRRPKLSAEQRATVVDDVLSGRRTGRAGSPAPQGKRAHRQPYPGISSCQRWAAQGRRSDGHGPLRPRTDSRRRACHGVGRAPGHRGHLRVGQRPTPPRAWSSGCWTRAPGSASSIRSECGGDCAPGRTAAAPGRTPWWYSAAPMRTFGSRRAWAPPLGTWSASHTLALRSGRVRPRQRRRPAGVHDRVHRGALRQQHGPAAPRAGRGRSVGAAAGAVRRLRPAGAR